MAADTVTAAGAAELSIGVAAGGIVGRGVLLDVPRSRGVPWLEPGDHVTVADVLAAERDQRVRIGPGRHRARPGRSPAAARRAGPVGRRRGPGRAASTVLPLLAERRVAALGSDGNNDTAPSAVAGVGFPVHVLAVNALGLHLLD